MRHERAGKMCSARRLIMDKKKRDFLKKGALAAAGLGVFAAASFDTARRMVRGLREGTAGVAVADAENKNSLPPEYCLTSNGTVTPGKGQRTAFNQCWGCTTFCGVRLHIDADKDEVVRAAGNPYNPLSTPHHLPMSMPVREALAALSARGDSGQKQRATVCGRGAAMLEANSNPFRILQCLKRVGKRGEGRWKSIPFEQLVAEVVDGGDLFGEGHVDGLKAIRDAKGPANRICPSSARSQTACCSPLLRKTAASRSFCAVSGRAPSAPEISANTGRIADFPSAWARSFPGRYPGHAAYQAGL